MGYVGGPSNPERVRPMVDSLDRRIVPPGVEAMWDYPQIEMRFSRLSLPRFVSRDDRIMRELGVRVSNVAKVMVRVDKFRTLRTIDELSGPRREFVSKDLIVLAAVVEGWTSEEIVEDLATLENCGALEFGALGGGFR